MQWATRNLKLTAVKENLADSKEPGNFFCLICRREDTFWHFDYMPVVETDAVDVISHWNLTQKTCKSVFAATVRFWYQSAVENNKCDTIQLVRQQHFSLSLLPLQTIYRNVCTFAGFNTVLNGMSSLWPQIFSLYISPSFCTLMALTQTSWFKLPLVEAQALRHSRVWYCPYSLVLHDDTCQSVSFHLPGSVL